MKKQPGKRRRGFLKRYPAGVVNRLVFSLFDWASCDEGRRPFLIVSMTEAFISFVLPIMAFWLLRRDNKKT